ncbi:MAG TPA: sigma-54 dependent transcriptional regulator [Candidatus Mcinerneyibacterium sp.]|nr:sigma-54 dependent transcriptional regulator [Candidatus Mcinerneyibacterium sp.]
MANILVLDDEKGMRQFLEIMLEKDGHNPTTAESEKEAIKLIKDDMYDLVISDLRLKEGNGISFLNQLSEISPSTYFIIITAYASLDTSLKAIKLGAFDYILKPFKIEVLRKQIDAALEKKRLIEENIYLRERLNKDQDLDKIIFENEKMKEIYKTAVKAAKSESTILINGESGTGKEMFAKLIHNHSFRKEKPFIAFNCGSLNENLLESELFGHVRGAFTGAKSNKDGLFTVADEGTIFLDEIAETSNNFQVKLLRVIQENKIKPVGSNNIREVDVRIIAASNKDLKKEMEAGNFRKDLFYRLNVIPISLPPLRERKDDIPYLATYFLENFSNGKKELSDEAVNLLMNYDFPGNIRELENMMERVSVLSTNKIIKKEDFSFLNVSAAGRDFKNEKGIKPLEEIENSYIKKAIEFFDGNKSKAAEALDVSRSYIYKKLKEMN